MRSFPLVTNCLCNCQESCVGHFSSQSEGWIVSLVYSRILVKRTCTLLNAPHAPLSLYLNLLYRSLCCPIVEPYSHSPAIIPILISSVSVSLSPYPVRLSVYWFAGFVPQLLLGFPITTCFALDTTVCWFWSLDCLTSLLLAPEYSCLLALDPWTVWLLFCLVDYWIIVSSTFCGLCLVPFAHA